MQKHFRYFLWRLNRTFPGTWDQKITFLPWSVNKREKMQYFVLRKRSKVYLIIPCRNSNHHEITFLCKRYSFPVSSHGLWQTSVCITLQFWIIGLWTTSCSPLCFLNSRPTSAAASPAAAASSAVAFPVAVVHGGAVAFVDRRGRAIEAILAVNLAVFQFFVWRLAVLVFSGDVAWHSVEWYNF